MDDLSFKLDYLTPARNFLQKTCLIQNERPGQKTTSSGGVLISKDGLVVTCAHNFDVNLENNWLSVRVHGRYAGFMPANVVEIHPLLDIAILKITNPPELAEGNVEPMEFEFAEFPDEIDLNWGDSVHVFSHTGSPFSLCSGNIAYPFHSTELGVDEGPLRRIEVRHLFDEILGDKTGIKDLEQTLPLIKVRGVEATYGTSGNALFKENNNSPVFVGITSFGRGANTYFVPASVVKGVVDNSSLLRRKDSAVTASY